MISQVHKFHKKFGLPLGDEDKLSQDTEAQQFRIGFMQEELDEFKLAIENCDRVKAFDALLDLAYVVYGTALFMGIDPATWFYGMEAVQAANMAKERATSADQSKRGTSLDVVKPIGWRGPEEMLRRLLNESN